jgi:hypothetical protein
VTWVRDQLGDPESLEVVAIRTEDLEEVELRG